LVKSTVQRGGEGIRCAMNTHNIPRPCGDVEPAGLERRWEAFVAAKAQAERTGAIADGIAAGRAWAAFLAAFVK